MKKCNGKKRPFQGGQSVVIKGKVKVTSPRGLLELEDGDLGIILRNQGHQNGTRLVFMHRLPGLGIVIPTRHLRVAPKKPKIWKDRSF